MKKYLLPLVIALLVSCQGNSQDKKAQKKIYKIIKTDAEWKSSLPALAYDVLRHAATERPYTGPLNDNKREGTYLCGGCKAPLYESQYKYDSKSGWPSFDRGIEENLEYDVDYKIGYPRSELKCNRCGSHLGHMFNDGPKKTTGQRHCINSAALTFIPKDEK